MCHGEPLLEELRHFLDVVAGQNDRSSRYGSELVRTLQAADRSLEKMNVRTCGKISEANDKAFKILRLFLTPAWWLLFLSLNQPF